MIINNHKHYLALLKGQGFEHKGEYDETVIYEKTEQHIDCFNYEGSTYYTIQTAPAGTLPTDTNYFGLMAVKGDKGNTGEKGEKGDSNTLTIGTVESGETASATITGEAPNQTLNLVLPRGEKGEKGAVGSSALIYTDERIISQQYEVGDVQWLPDSHFNRPPEENDVTFIFASRTIDDITTYQLVLLVYVSKMEVGTDMQTKFSVYSVMDLVLDNAVTREEFDSAIGDITTLLDSINGESV